MPMMQIFVPDELDKKLKYYVVQNGFKTKHEAVIGILQKKLQ